MPILRRVLFLGCALLSCAAARAHESEPMVLAYEMLPTAWDASLTASARTSPIVKPAVSPMPGAHPVPSTSAPASTLAPPTISPGYVTPASVIGSDSCCGDGCVACGSPCLNFGAYPLHGFWFATAELTVFHPSYDNGYFALDDDRSVVAPRLVFGWESPRGLGLRTRFWWMEEDSEIVTEAPLPPEAEVNLNAHRFDFDVYRRFTFDGSSIALGGGLTVAEMGWELVGVKIADAGTGVNFLVEARHEVVRRPTSTLGLLARGRWASLVGEWRDPDSADRNHGDTTLGILEAGVGYDFVYHCRRCDLVFQWLLESQSWQVTLGEIGYFGQSISGGVRW